MNRRVRTEIPTKPASLSPQKLPGMGVARSMMTIVKPYFDSRVSKAAEGKSA